jgi:uncharacterized membrane protein YhaH (DUF805 family)
VTRRRRFWLWALVVLALVLALLLAVVPGVVEARLNRVRGGSGRISPRAAELQRRLLVADMHADSLL